MQQFKRSMTALLGCLITFFASAQDKWELQALPIQTRWTSQVNPENVLPEYPRPQLVRQQWTNLNGLWDYSITGKNAGIPQSYTGKILVPFPLESALSGVKKKITAEQCLWYHKTINHVKRNGYKTILHFGAVDQQATVYVNGQERGKHSGGYTAFNIDITDVLKDGLNDIVVKVLDPTDQGIWPHGKQVSNPANIYYTPSSGVWQTVWLEQVPIVYIAKLAIIPDIDKGIVNVTVYSSKSAAVSVTIEGKTVKGKSNAPITIPVPNARLWSPSNPYLYDLSARLGNDIVSSYFGMRKVSVDKDERGYYRIFLNNKYLYNLGTLDQGFWPDGLYTAPTDEALKFDIEAIKAMGFNTIRKHIKVEPARWYFHCDKIGMLVWQDFVNPHQGLPEGSKQAFEVQLKETMDQLHNHPSITTWVLFNERWGRYDQERLTKLVKQADPSRLLNAHSGEMLWVNEKLRDPAPNAWANSEIADVHSYPDPMNAPAKEGRVQILGEFGGIGVFIPDHQWNTGSAWGYVNEKPAGLQTKYAIMNQHLQLLEKEGLAGSIYTQPFDVEGEQNGLMTYDRSIIKIPFEALRKIHAPLNNDNGLVKTVNAHNADISDPAIEYTSKLQQYIEGNFSDYKKLSMLASQTGDAAGKNRFISLYIKNLKAPYNDTDLTFIENSVSRVTDPGFSVLLEQLSIQENRSRRKKLMNIVFTDIIQPHVPTGDSNPDWVELEKEIQPFGTVGEEIFLRAKTIHTFNQQDWITYTPAARTYLAKYGANLKPEEKNMFQEQIDAHK